MHGSLSTNGKLYVLKYIFIVRGVYTVRGFSNGWSFYFLSNGEQQSVFSRNAKWWRSIVVSVNNKI